LGVLPLAEAMAAGMPVIATNYSGNTDFMDSHNSFLIPFSLREYPIEDETLGGMMHAQPDVPVLAHTMRGCFDGHVDMNTPAVRAQADMRRFSPKSVAKLIVDRMRSIGEAAVAHASYPGASLSVFPGFQTSPELQVCRENPSPPPLLLPSSPKRIVMVTSWQPRRCGIAEFASNLVKAMRDRGVDVKIVALTVNIDHYEYSSVDVIARIRRDVFSDYAAAAALINALQFDAVVVQHEFGLFGPNPAGAFLSCFLSLLRIPILTVLHTVERSLGDLESAVLVYITQRSSRTLVMSNQTLNTLRTSFLVNGPVSIIAHGVPSIAAVNVGERDNARVALEWEGRVVLMSNGLIHPDKGYHTVLDALPAAMEEVPNLLYVVVGQVHGQSLEGKAYYAQLKRTAAQHGALRDRVIFIEGYQDAATLQRLLRAADMFVTPYPKEGPSNSGTLSMAMAAGLACIATPFLHARDRLRNGNGILVPYPTRHNSKAALTSAISLLAGNETLRLELGRRAQAASRENEWPLIADRYLAELRGAQTEGLLM
jgi:glycosyltransferase involved in cell wall biosynthesis